MVNDPGYERHLGRGVNKERAVQERERLFKIIEELAQIGIGHLQRTGSEDLHLLIQALADPADLTLGEAFDAQGTHQIFDLPGAHLAAILARPVLGNTHTGAHPQKEADRGAVKAVRIFMEEAEIEP